LLPDMSLSVAGTRSSSGSALTSRVMKR
jgi:hypothetical protein